MSFTVTITREPNPGPPKERTIDVTYEIGIDRNIEPSNASLTFELRVRNDVQSDFRLLTTKERPVLTFGDGELSFTELIDARPPYAVKVIGILEDGDEKIVSEDVREVETQESQISGTSRVDSAERTVGTIDGKQRVDVTPEIGGIEPITMETDFQLPFDNNAVQTPCGQTIRTQNGDRDWRVTINGVLSLQQFRQLQQRRRFGNTTAVPVTTAEFGTIDVDFDQISVNRVDEEAVGTVNNVVGPLIAFQIQTKEDSTSTESFGEDFIGDE